MGFFKSLVNSNDKTVEAPIVFLGLGILVFCGLAIYHVIALRNAFNPSDYGIGLGSILGGGGAASLGQGWQRRIQNTNDYGFVKPSAGS